MIALFFVIVVMSCVLFMGILEIVNCVFLDYRPWFYSNRKNNM